MDYISNDERREIAARLRAIDVSDLCDSNGLIIDSPVEGDLLLMRVIYETCDYRDGLHYFPSHFKAKAVVELLADLIDRPTARREHNGAYWRCAHCGAFIRKDAVIIDGLDVVPLRHCGNCGRELDYD